MLKLYIFGNKILCQLLNMDGLNSSFTQKYKLMGDTRVRKEYSRGLAVDGEMSGQADKILPQKFPCNTRYSIYTFQHPH
jgi:hypothetical protein